jgi:hypothetical protein
MPEMEKKTIEEGYGPREVFKYHCPNCGQKELPWLGQWRDGGAGEAWNRIAQERNYKRRTLKYNMHGVCIDEAFKVFEWRDKKKGHQHITITFYLDNGMYYYCYDFWYGNGGAGSGVWIGDPCFPSMDAAKQHALRMFEKHYKETAGIVEKLLKPEPVQGILF